MSSEIIDEIYEKTIDIVLNGIEAEYINEIKEGYKEYLNRIYSNITFKNNNANSANIWLNFEKKVFLNKNSKTKKQMLIKDRNYEEIEQISFEGKKYAIEKMHKNIDMNEYDAENYIKLLQEKLKNVRDFNYDRALNLVSEGILDFLYSCGKTDCQSLRIYNIRNKL